MDVEHELRMLARLKSDRAVLDSHLEEIAERVLPRQIGFLGEQVKGDKRTQKVFDSRPALALERFAAVMDSMLTPRQSIWHDLRSTIPQLNKVQRVKDWFWEANHILFSARYNPRANFAGQNTERWISTGAFGTGTVFTDFMGGTGLRYRNLHLKDTYFIENHQGIIDTVFRCFKMTARQAAQKWGMSRLPERMQKAMDNPNTALEEFEFVHLVRPRNDYQPERVDAKGKPWASFYIAVKDKVLMEEGGYTSWPFSISRYTIAPGETYGRSPAMMALPDIKMLNEMSKTDIRMAHRAVSPPLLIPEDGILGGGMTVDLRPDGLIPGGMDINGRQLIKPLDSGSRMEINEAKMEQRRTAIDDHFLVTLFQILIETPRMTATEALIRAQEKGMLLTPTMGRQQSEAIGPQIERELDLLIRNRVIPPLPPELVEAGGEYEIVYDSPMSRMQRAEELVGVQRTMEILAPFAQINPEILDVFNQEELARGTAEVSGVPAPMINSPEEIAAIRQQRAQQQEMAQMLEAAKPVAGAMKDVAQANQLLTGE